MHGINISTLTEYHPSINELIDSMINCASFLPSLPRIITSTILCAGWASTNIEKFPSNSCSATDNSLSTVVLVVFSTNIPYLQHIVGSAKCNTLTINLLTNPCGINPNLYLLLNCSSLADGKCGHILSISLGLSSGNNDGTNDLPVYIGSVPSNGCCLVDRK